jgi:hypothetical protein
VLVWQLIQVDHLRNRPLVFVGDQWKALVEWGREYWLAGNPDLADPEDLEIPICVDTVDEAVHVIRQNLEDWASEAV